MADRKASDNALKEDVLKFSAKQIKWDHHDLIEWYKVHQRPLPWRQNKDPYRIWISEIMLQQTTVVAVIPFFERFMTSFPNVKALALAEEADVIQNWAGLGYYSRARNLHKTARWIHSNGFPKNANELIQLPGLGDYTSRAIASIAFGENVGVLDGNVIRVLSRKWGLAWEWWKPKAKEALQALSDRLAEHGQSSELNQGLMELGRTVCTPKNPTCLLCPWQRSCVAFENEQTEILPLKKQRKKSEIWVWKIEVLKNKNRFGMIKNDYAPFLKGAFIFPGTVEKKTEKPKKFLAKHMITHHEIFIVLAKQNEVSKRDQKLKKLDWYSPQELERVSPSSMLKKIIRSLPNEDSLP